MKACKYQLVVSLMLSLCVYCSSFSQQEIVKTQGITGPLHRANIGKIIFIAKPLTPVESLQEGDVLNSFQLDQKANLSFRAFMGTSLTNYLHKLQPGLSPDELTRQGSYQFTFLVDGRSVYQDNYQPAAIKPEIKNTETTFGLSLLDSADPEAGRIWKRFLLNGGDQALTPGKHLLKIELRPYLRTTENKVGDLIAAGELPLTVPPPVSMDSSLTAVQPITPNSGWEISKEPYSKNHIEELNRKIAENFYRDIKSIVVIKNGQLLIEEYFNGATRDTLQNTRSVGKSFTSPLIGLAISDGYIKSEDQTLKDFYDLPKFANYSPKKERVTLKSLMTMSSGFDANDDDPNSPGNEEKMYPTTDWVKFALDLPMDEKSEIGEKWRYFTAGMILLGDVLNKSVPGGLEKYAEKKLFQPLGISKYEWQFTPQNVPNTAGGIKMSALDFAKFGQLYSNRGRWNDKQILSPTWLDKSLSRQQKVPYGDNTYYGYLFWNSSFNVNGKTYEVDFATGNGGNKIFVFKDQPLVIIITATAFGKWYMHTQINNMMERYILPAVIK